MEAIYASGTTSLAALEVLVHFSVLPRDFVLTEIHIPTSVKIETVRDQDLDPNWAILSVAHTQEIGLKWASKNSSAVLSVPSSILAGERNYVINPKHPDFAQIQFLPARSFRFDPRLK